MKIVLIIGSHKRHLYFANELAKHYDLTGVICQTRENIIPTPPKFSCRKDKLNYIKHFKDRDEAENKWFGEQEFPVCLKVSKEEINGEKVRDFIQYIKPDIVITFGCTILKELLPFLPEKTINIHQGLSPRYRGVATLFWPFYFYEPNHAGTTIHYIDRRVDTGDIIHQSVPTIERDDGIHDVACKAVIKSTQDLIKLLALPSWKSQKQTTSGKLFVSTDFRPEHLRNIYKNCIVNLYLDKKITPPEPKLFNQNL